jgi:hypothetical protein
MILHFYYNTLHSILLFSFADFHLTNTNLLLKKKIFFFRLMNTPALFYEVKHDISDPYNHLTINCL